MESINITRRIWEGFLDRLLGFIGIAIISVLFLFLFPTEVLIILGMVVIIIVIFLIGLLFIIVQWG